MLYYNFVTKIAREKKVDEIIFGGAKTWLDQPENPAGKLPYTKIGFIHEQGQTVHMSEVLDR